MYLQRVDMGFDWSDLVAVRLLRRWVAARTELAAPLPALIALGHEIGCPAQVAVALGSLFQLTEGCLGRRLEAECCCSRSLGTDERAILLMIAVSPTPAQPLATREIPHGLPAALAWAASSVRRLLAFDRPAPDAVAPGACPFAPPSAPGRAAFPAAIATNRSRTSHRGTSGERRR